MGQADTPYPFGPCAGKQLYLAYARWCRANGVRFPRNSIQFLNRVGKMPGWLCGDDARFRIWDNTHYTGPKTLITVVLYADWSSVVSLTRSLTETTFAEV
uniref:Uncharacterized protein n=1 Tax=Candidatus Kentrum sp. LFY TaxID=2126342 RepID=A0A450UKJ1_9GAMM|nr:MAG: hypothetical protein BECKLFY1418A_GA0070994_102822 [Candidatus Kentron sp. LFY]